MGIGNVSWTSVVASAIGQGQDGKTLKERSQQFDETRLEFQARLSQFNDADYVRFDPKKKLLTADSMRAGELTDVVKTAPALDKEYAQYMEDFKNSTGKDLNPFNFEDKVRESFNNFRKGLANVVNANFNPSFSENTLKSIQTSEPPTFLEDVGKLFSQLFNSRIKDVPLEKRTYMEPSQFPAGNELGSVENPFKPGRNDYKGGVQNDKTLNDLNNVFRNDGLIEGDFIHKQLLKEAQNLAKEGDLRKQLEQIAQKLTDDTDLMVLPTNDYNNGLGNPELMFFEQDGNGNGVKLTKAPQLVKYVDPFDNKTKTGIYLEAQEPAGEKGEGGVNKILIAEAPRAAVIPTTFTYGANGRTTSAQPQSADLIEARKAGRTE